MKKKLRLTIKRTSTWTETKTEGETVSILPADTKALEFLT